jgi:hypothetical protein
VYIIIIHSRIPFPAYETIAHAGNKIIGSFVKKLKTPDQSVIPACLTADRLE